MPAVPSDGFSSDASTQATAPSLLADAGGLSSVPTAPWAVTPSAQPSAALPPPPPPMIGAPSTAGSLHRARIEFVSDDHDLPVDVFLVVGMDQVTQWVTPGPSPSPSSMFSPYATSASPFLLSNGGTVGVFGSTPLPMQVNVERRRFLCRTPCSVELSSGQLQVHLRTRDATIGTALLELPEAGATYRARTRSVGWYTLGQALLWTGIAAALAGITLVGQSQAAPCPVGHCGLYEGIGALAGGAVGLGFGIPLILLHNSRIERVR